MRWLTMMKVALGPCSATAKAAPQPVSLLLKPSGLFDGIDRKRHPVWQFLLTGKRIVAVGPNLSAPTLGQERDLGTEGAGFADVGLKSAIDKGIVPGPRLSVSVAAFV